VAAAGESVRHEVEAPALVWSIRKRHRRPHSGHALAAAAHGQALLGIEPVELLAVHVDAFSLEEDTEPPVAEASPFRRSRSRTSPSPGSGYRRTVLGSIRMSSQARRCEKPRSAIRRSTASRRAARQVSPDPAADAAGAGDR
jgi:hypothetical protein